MWSCYTGLNNYRTTPTTCPLDIVRFDEEEEVRKVQKQDEEPAIIPPTIPPSVPPQKLSYNKFAIELSNTALMVSEIACELITHGTVHHHLSKSTALLSTDLWLHPSFLRQWGTLLTQIVVPPLSEALETVSNRRLPSFQQRLREEELSDSLYQKLNELACLYWKGELTTGSFERKFIEATSHTDEEQQERLDTHRRFLTERTQKEFQLKYNELLRFVRCAIEQVAIIMQSELEDEQRWCTVSRPCIPTVPPPLPSYPQGSIGIQLNEVVSEVKRVLQRNLTPNALKHWYENKLAPMGLPTAESIAHLKATREEAAQVSSVLVGKIIQQCESGVHLFMSRLLALAISFDTGNLAERLCPYIEQHLQLYFQEGEWNPGTIHSCAELYEGVDADYRFLKERIHPHLGPLLFQRPNITDGLIQLLAPALHAKVKHLFNTEGATASKLQELFSELGDQMLLALFSPQILNQLEQFLQAPALAKLIIESLEPKWENSIPQPDQDPVWLAYSRLKQGLAQDVANEQLTTEIAVQKQAAHLLQASIQQSLSNVTALGITDLNKNISITAVHLFKMIQNPKIRRSLLFHLLEQTILHLRCELKQTNDPHTVLQTATKCLKSEKVITDKCIARLVRMGQNLLSQVGEQNPQRTTFVSRIATQLISRLKGWITSSIRQSSVDIDKNTLIEWLINRLRNTLLNPNHGLEAQIQLLLKDSVEPARSKPLRRASSCSNLPRPDGKLFL